MVGPSNGRTHCRFALVFGLGELGALANCDNGSLPGLGFAIRTSGAVPLRVVAAL